MKLNKMYIKYYRNTYILIHKNYLLKVRIFVTCDSSSFACK